MRIITKKIGLWVKNVAIYALVFIAIYNAVNWWRQPMMPANPVLQFTTIQGQTIDLQQMSQQRPVLVYFWGSWCGVCRQTSPSVDKLAKSADYSIVSVAVNSGEPNEVQQYLSQHGWQFVTINDEDGKIFTNWQGQVTPSFIILKDGKMVQGLTGIHPAWELKLRLWLLR